MNAPNEGDDNNRRIRVTRLLDDRLMWKNWLEHFGALYKRKILNMKEEEEMWDLTKQFGEFMDARILELMRRWPQDLGALEDEEVKALIEKQKRQMKSKLSRACRNYMYKNGCVRMGLRMAFWAMVAGCVGSAACSRSCDEMRAAIFEEFERGGDD